MADINLVIADTNRSFVDNISAYFNLKRDIKIVAVCRSGAGLADAINRHHPDAVLMDTVLEDTDGLTVLKRLHSEFNDIVFVVCSEFASEAVVTRAARCGATAFICKPADRIALYETISESVTIMREQYTTLPAPSDEIDAAIAKELLDKGISSGSEGFRLLRQAIKYVISSCTKNISMTKQLYPELARVTGSTSARVERNMRTAIARAYARGALNHCAKRPTNRELIMMIVSGISSTNII